jgi:hypothetical protein
VKKIINVMIFASPGRQEGFFSARYNYFGEVAKTIDLS